MNNINLSFKLFTFGQDKDNACTEMQTSQEKCFFPFDRESDVSSSRTLLTSEYFLNMITHTSNVSRLFPPPLPPGISQILTQTHIHMHSLKHIIQIGVIIFQNQVLCFEYCWTI